MGNQTPQVEYARFIQGTETEGYSAELVNTVNKDQDTYQYVHHEGMDTLWKQFKMTAKRFADRDWLGTRDKTQEGSPYVWKTFGQVEKIVTNMAKGYVAMNLLDEVVGEKDTKWRFMGIYAKNREEWSVTHLANLSLSGTTVAFYDTLGPQAVEFVLRQTKLQTMSIDKKYIKSLTLLKMQGKADHLKNLIVFPDSEEIDEQQLKDATEAGLRVIMYNDVIAEGEKFEGTLFPEPEPETTSLLCYTSGTTGNPKAAKLTHKNFVATACATQFKGNFSEEDSYISYLPMAHSFEQGLFTVGITYGTKIGYYCGDVLKLTDDCQVLQPTVFPSVPRLFNRIHDKIKAGLKDLQGMKARLANRAIDSKLYYLQNQALYEYYTYDKLVCNKFRNILGGRVRLMCTGSAPIDPAVLDFLKVCFCCPILEGYGQTESCAASTLTDAADPKSGHVGGPLPSIKIRLRDIPEMEYRSTDKPYPRGEICFKGPAIFPGYYDNDEKTKEALSEDGWLASGDVGVIFPNGSIKIVDRAKNIFKLAQGEYIAPEKLENVYIQSTFVGQVFVHGDSLQPYLVSIIVPDFGGVKKWAAANNKDFEALKKDLNDADLKKAILDDLNQLATANKFNGLERIKKFHLHNKEFTVEEDLLTPSMKLKRPVAAKRFKAEIDALYGQ